MPGRGYPGWSNWVAGCRFLVVPESDAGVGGNTSTQLLARFDLDVIAKAPDIVVILIGTNDITQGDTAGDPPAVTAATVLANVTEMIVRTRAIGAKIILIKVMPRGSAAAQMNANEITAWETINAGYAAMAALDLLVVDTEPYIGSMTPYHGFIFGYTVDNLHPSIKGSFYAGIPIAAAIDRLVGSGYTLFTANNDPANAVINGFMTGTSGTLTQATGAVADNWSVTGLAGVTSACSLVALTGGGNFQQIVLSGTYTGSNNVVVLSQTVNFDTLFASGDRVEVHGVISVTGTLVGVTNLTLGASLNGVSLSADGIGFPTASPSRVMADGPWTIVLRSPAVILTAPPGTGTVTMTIHLDDTLTTDPVSGTISFARLGVRGTVPPAFPPVQSKTSDQTAPKTDTSLVTSDVF